MSGRREKPLSLHFAARWRFFDSPLELFLFRFFYADPVRLVTELDGTRIIGAEASEFLQIVPGTCFVFSRDETCKEKHH